MQLTQPRINVRHIVLLFLFLTAMELANKTFFFVIAALLVFLLFGSKIIQVNVGMVPLVLLAVSLLIFSPNSRGGITSMIKPFCYLICAFLGYNLIETEDREIQEKQLIRIIVLMSIGQFAHFLLNLVFNYDLIGQRNTIDIWTKEVKSATGQATLATMMVGLAVAALFCKISRWKKLLAIGCLALIAFYNFKLAGRTLFVLMAIAVGTCLLFQLFEEKSLSRKLQIVMAVGAIACLVIILVVNNVFGLQDRLRETNFYNRFFGQRASIGWDEDGRFAAKRVYLTHFLDYPWGGFHLRPIAGNYAHDILLDTYDEAGIFALLAMLWFLIVLLNRSRKVFGNKNIGMNTRMIMTCFVVTMCVEFMIEPILAGMPAQLMSFCVIYGALCKVSNNLSDLPEGENLYARSTD